MATITVNEVSQNYTYNIGNNSYATVALPITACWGPGYTWEDYATGSHGNDECMDAVAWYRFPATQAGMEAFVAAFRGPEAQYKLAKDFSYYQALTYLSSGHDVLVCRVSCGEYAQRAYKGLVPDKDNPDVDPAEVEGLTLRAKYPGSFGNALEVEFTRKLRYGVKGDEPATYWMMVIYATSNAGVRTAVENKIFTFDIEGTSDTIAYIKEVESEFVTISISDSACEQWIDVAEIAPIPVGSEAISNDDPNAETEYAVTKNLVGGSDMDPSLARLAWARAAAQARFAMYRAEGDTPGGLETAYIAALNNQGDGIDGTPRGSAIAGREIHMMEAMMALPLITDKIAYAPNRLVMPGWDDVDFRYLDESIDFYEANFADITPLHKRMLEVAYGSRCATAYIDIPRSLQRRYVWNEAKAAVDSGYAQKLSRWTPDNLVQDANGIFFNTHSALFAPWGQYQYTGTGKMNIANPAFLAIMIQRGMILNQSIQYEWALPENRKHNINIGKLDYIVCKKLLDKWQNLEGVGVNVITNIPDMGISLWGNSTLYDVPPATYQALANLSTRLLFNAVENVVYKVGISITFAYNNAQAYSKFYAGVTPLLDTMKNVGAIEGYYVKMAADIDGLDQVNSNTVVGKIYLIVNGVINDIVVDLIALPAGTDLSQYQ